MLCRMLSTLQQLRLQEISATSSKDCQCPPTNPVQAYIGRINKMQKISKDGIRALVVLSQDTVASPIYKHPYTPKFPCLLEDNFTNFQVQNQFFCLKPGLYWLNPSTKGSALKFSSKNQSTFDLYVLNLY